MTDVIYQGYSADELTVQYNVAATVDNLPEYQKWNGEQSARVRATIPCQCDIPYGEADIQKLDIYAPDGVSGAPVLIDLHGGGWTAGSKNARAFPAEAIVPNGIVWVPIDYGLAPDFGMDAIVDHVRQAIAWVFNNIAEYGGDPNKIFVSGNSAGGHLTGTCLIAGWTADYGIPEDVIKGACAMSGVFDLDCLVHAAEGPNDAIKMDLDTAKRHSPLFHIPENSPPLIVAFGEPELPEFRRQSEEFATAWMGAGHDVRLIEVPDAHHFAMSREFADTDSELHRAMMAMIGV